MKKIILTVSLLLLFTMIAGTFCSCSKRSIVGTWSSWQSILKETFVFRSDGTGVLTFGSLSYPFKYKVKGGTIEFDWNGAQKVFEYKCNGETLELVWTGGRGEVAYNKED